MGALVVLGVGVAGVVGWARVSREGKAASATVSSGTAPDAVKANAPTSPSPAPAVLPEAPPIPASPDPSWEKCPQDCGYGKLKACEYRGHPREEWVVGYQGTCWVTFKNPGWNVDPKRRKPCFGTTQFDPPADAPEELQSLCFIPLQPKTVNNPNAVKQ